MSQEYDDERLERGEVRYFWLTDYASIRVGGTSGKHPDPTGRPVYISDNPSTGWIEQLTMPKLVRAMSPEIIDKAFEGLATLFEWETKRLAGLHRLLRSSVENHRACVFPPLLFAGTYGLQVARSLAMILGRGDFAVLDPDRSDFVESLLRHLAEKDDAHQILLVEGLTEAGASVLAELLSPEGDHCIVHRETGIRVDISRANWIMVCENGSYFLPENFLNQVGRFRFDEMLDDQLISFLVRVGVAEGGANIADEARSFAQLLLRAVYTRDPGYLADQMRSYVREGM